MKLLTRIFAIFLVADDDSLKERHTRGRASDSPIMKAYYLTALTVYGTTACVAWSAFSSRPRHRRTKNRLFDKPLRSSGLPPSVILDSHLQLNSLSVSGNEEYTRRRSTVKGVTLKIAVDANGGATDLAETKSERFTSPQSLDMVHRLRCDSDAVLIGRGTVQADDPSLTVRRGVECETQPLRVVLDPNLRLLQEQAAQDYVLFRDGLPTVVYHSLQDVDDCLLDVDEETITCVCVEQGDNFLRTVLDNLTERFGVSHLMVEGGPATALEFLKQKLVDRCILVVAPLCFREPLASGIDASVLHVAGLELRGKRASGDDEIQCWSRKDLAWPSEGCSDWP